MLLKKFDIKKFKANLETWKKKTKERLAELKIHLLKLSSNLLMVLFPIAIVMAFTNFGPYLNHYLFYNPLLQLRANFGFQPKLDNSIRLIIVEDRALDKIGRLPTFSEWQSVAKLLFANGFETVMLQGFQNIESEIGEVSERHTQGKFIVGAVDFPNDRNLRALPVEKIPGNLFVDGDSSSQILNESKFALGPEASLFPLIDGLGNLNLHDDNTMPLAYRTPMADKILPNMGLYSVPGLRWGNGGFLNAHQKLPRPADNKIYIDFVDSSDAMTKALPVSAFYEKEQKKIKSSLSEKILEKLSGGKIAVLIPEAYTGSRFIDTPLGKVPSYLSTVSVLNSTLEGYFIYRPIASWIIILLGVPVLFSLLFFTRTKIALYGSASLGIVQFIFNGVFLWTLGWVLPAPELLIMCLSGWLVRFVHHQIKTFKDKMKLSHDLEIGSTVQTLLLPKEFSGTSGRWQYHVIFKPYGPMSGDWVQIYQSPPNCIKPFTAIAIGDVVGKGPSAALNTAAIASVWNSFRDDWDQGKVEIDSLIMALNRSIFRTFKGQQNSTLSLALLNEENIIVTSYAAPAWFQIDAKKKAIKRIPVPPQNPLGYDGECSKIQKSVLTPVPGEVFMAYSDGVMDGSAARRKFQQSITEDGFQASDTQELFVEVEAKAVRAGQEDILPDDFTLLLIREVGKQDAVEKAA